MSSPIIWPCPIFVTALSAIVLREHVGWRRWSAILIGFCGVLIALRPSAQTLSWPALIALGGSLSFAVLMLITRSLRGDARYRDGVLAIRRHVPARRGDVAVRLGDAEPAAWACSRPRGCISVSALFCVNRSLKLAPASVVVPYQYSMIVWAVMFGYRRVRRRAVSRRRFSAPPSSSARGSTFSCASAARARGGGGQSAGVSEQRCRRPGVAASRDPQSRCRWHASAPSRAISRFGPCARRDDSAAAFIARAASNWPSSSATTRRCATGGSGRPASRSPAPRSDAARRRSTGSRISPGCCARPGW